MQPISRFCIQVSILLFSINYFILSDGRTLQHLEVDKTQFTEEKMVKSQPRYLDFGVDLSNILPPLPSPSYPPVPLNPTRTIYGPSPSPGPPLNVEPPRSKGAPPGQFAVWCVAKPTVPDSILQRAMDYACGTHAPDCQPIQTNGPCFQPNTLLSHASFAFNSYWQRAKQAGGTCDFGGTAMLVTVDPSFGKCDFVYV